VNVQSDFIELKSTDNQTLFVRRDAVSAFEVVPASQRVEGHIKLYISGFKFLVQADQEELIKKLNG
jgi:hypothetical protein